MIRVMVVGAPGDVGGGLCTVVAGEARCEVLAVTRATAAAGIGAIHRLLQRGAPSIAFRLAKRHPGAQSR